MCKRQLTLSELNLAIAIDVEVKFLDTKKMPLTKSRIVEILGSLVRLNEDTSVVELLHFSVVEYLTEIEFLENRATNIYYLDKEKGNAELTKYCLTYLSFTQNKGSPHSSTTEGEEGLELYAILHWPYHAMEAKHDSSHIPVVARFLRYPSTPSYLAWSQAWSQIGAGDAFPLVSPPHGISLHLFSFSFRD
jgi:hypothetical protein